MKQCASALPRSTLDQAVLELPEGWLELDNAARMRLLQRQAQIQGMDVAIISRHEPTRQAAKAVGVPVFRRAEDAAGGKWSMDPNLPPVNVADPAANLPEAPPWRREDIVTRAARPTQHRARQRRIDAEERYRKPTPAWVRLGGNLAMGAIIAGALLIFALYVLPAATITVVPGRDAVTVNLPLIANADLAESDLEANELAARLVETTLIETGSTQTTGSRQKATENAVGAVTFTNLGTASVAIPRSTVVSTSSGSPVNFRTTQDAELAGGVGSASKRADRSRGTGHSRQRPRQHDQHRERPLALSRARHQSPGHSRRRRDPHGHRDRGRSDAAVGRIEGAH